MDIFSNSMEVTKMALDGLYERQKAIASNTANVNTPNYRRKDVVFEDSLASVIKKEEIKQQIKEQNSNILKNKKELSVNEVISEKNNPLLMNLMNTDYKKEFKTEIIPDFTRYDNENDNNVILEKEMMDMAQASLKYNVLATLEGKMFTGMQNIIRGQ